jgi:voltage-gated potassium channel
MRFSMANLRPRTAVILVAVSTLVIVSGSTVIAWTLDSEDFGSIGEALWWSLQTVTTVGYGDIVPQSTRGQVIGGVVMLVGIAASAVLTALITSALFETVLRRQRADEEAGLETQLQAIEEQLAAIAERLEPRRD